MDRTLKIISDFAASLSYEDLPVSTVRAVKHIFIDSLGCAVGAYHGEPCKLVRKLCFPTGSPLTARVIGALIRTSPEMAAFANGLMVRYLDFNDSYRVKDAGHPSDCLSAVLAMGEAVHGDGKTLITAATIAYEMQTRIIEEVKIEDKGWDQTVYIGLGSALGAGKILGLTEEQFANAAALSVTTNISLYQNRIGELSMWKAGAAGMAARQGVFAALMAKEGMTGPEEVFEGQFGLMNTVTGPFNFEPLGGNGRQFGVERTNLKYYPTRDCIQLVIKTVLDLREKVSPQEIKSLRVKTYESAYHTAVAPQQLRAPKTRETADHSMWVSVAVAFIDGNVTPETFSRERFRDKDILDIIDSMHIEVDPEFTKQTPDKRNCRIEATTHSGDTRVAERVVTAEELQKGWTDEEVEAKFLGLVRDILTPSRARASLNLLWHLEDLDDTARILDNLKI